MVEAEISGHQYRIDKLSAYQQLHVSRRIAPLIPGLVPLFGKYAQLMGQAEADGSRMDSADARFSGFRIDAGEIGALARPLLEAFAEMTDQNCEYVVDTCLSVVKRRSQTGDWTDFWNKAAKRSMFHDSEDIATVLQLTAKVITANLGNSISALIGTSPGGARTTQKTPPGGPSRGAKSTS